MGYFERFVGMPEERLNKLYKTYSKNYLLKKMHMAEKHDIGMEARYSKASFATAYMEAFEEAKNTGKGKTNNVMQNLINAQVDYKFSRKQYIQAKEWMQEKGLKMPTELAFRSGRKATPEFWNYISEKNKAIIEDIFDKTGDIRQAKQVAREAIAYYDFGSPS